MNDFWLYFTLGFEHVLDWMAYDHILFIVVLCAAYSFASWRKLFVLVTLFTVGHSVSLLISNQGWATVSPVWIEFLIPLTIIMAAIYNLVTVKRFYSDASRSTSKANALVLYGFTVFFGIIHGFGFGRYFNQINDEKEWSPLLEFALGIELAQMIIVMIVLILGYMVYTFARIKKRDWILIISSVVLGMAIPMLIANWPTAH